MSKIKPEQRFFIKTRDLEEDCIEIKHPDGTITRVYKDGSTKIVEKNGKTQ